MLWVSFIGDEGVLLIPYILYGFIGHVHSAHILIEAYFEAAFGPFFTFLITSFCYILSYFFFYFLNGVDVVFSPFFLHNKLLPKIHSSSKPTDFKPSQNILSHSLIIIKIEFISKSKWEELSHIEFQGLIKRYMKDNAMMMEYLMERVQ